MYASGNPRTKAALKRWLSEGRKVYPYNPSLGADPKPGQRVTLEGPHYPKPHTWYATAEVDVDGFLKPGTVR